MEKNLFDDLVASIHEAGAIRRGEKPPARVSVSSDDARHPSFTRESEPPCDDVATHAAESQIDELHRKTA